MGICTIYDLVFSTYPWPSWGKGQFCHNRAGKSSWHCLVQWENSYHVRFELGSNHLTQITVGKYLRLSFLRRKTEILGKERDGESTTLLCTLFQPSLVLNEKAQTSHLNFLWLWLETFVLILFSTKSQTHLSTHFLTRKNPIRYTALVILFLFS